jgi:N-carbamoyl-L-amino-acid hydrolase
VLDSMEAEFRASLPEELAPLKLEFDEKRIWNSPVVKFDADLIACVRHGAEQAGYPTRDMVSGAGHDAAYVARVAPTTMIFVPCAGGLSHNEAEATSFEECAAGAQVLLNAVVEYDRRLAP